MRRRFWSIVAQLARDTRGNALMITAMALFPLLAVIGSAVDMSVAYAAKTRLQGACDSAALAGRRVLRADTLSDLPTDPVRLEVDKFLGFNFPQHMYRTTPFTPVVTKPSAGTVRVAASTHVPTTIMHLFGFRTLPISVTCEASQNFVNTDIVLVLDVTGSMTANIADGKGGTTTRAQALRDAVMALYGELAPVQAKLEAANMRLRYGIVPYSSAVNVGHLLHASSAANIADSWTYQSRVTETVAWTGDKASCEAYSGTFDSAAATCTLWVYKPVTFDTARFKTAASTAIPSRSNGSTSTWNGCIEERRTTSSIAAGSSYTIPDQAFDLNIDLLASAASGTTWGPHWPEVVYYGRKSTPSYAATAMTSRDSSWYACPSEAKRMTAWSKSDLQSYVDKLSFLGGTYHDVGMIWGVRLIANDGVFGDGEDSYNSMPVAKHIIFMTDGALAPNADSYGAYGVENLDQRVTASAAASGQLGRDEQRFKMMCNQAKQMKVTVWVVAFATSSTAALNECASGANQISTSTNKEQLISKFVEIGKNIGTLRLTQ